MKNSFEKLDNELHVKVKKCMHVFYIFPTNHRASSIKRLILPKMFEWCSKKVSAITNVGYNYKGIDLLFFLFNDGFFFLINDIQKFSFFGCGDHTLFQLFESLILKLHYVHFLLNNVKYVSFCFYHYDL